MYIKKDKTSFISCSYYITPPDDYYEVNDPILEEKFFKYFPDIDLVVENDQLVDIISTKAPDPSTEEKIEKLEADMAYLAMMADIELEEN